MFWGYTEISLSVRPCERLCTKYYFLSNGWWGYQCHSVTALLLFCLLQRYTFTKQSNDFYRPVGKRFDFENSCGKKEKLKNISIAPFPMFSTLSKTIPLIEPHLICFLQMLSVNSLPNGKLLNWSRLKAFTGDKVNVT